jgi:iron complex outermembrane recepter protein
MKQSHRSGSSRKLRPYSNHAGLKRSFGLAAAALCCVPLTGGAQESGLAIEEIVVTAQRREETLRDVPISVSAYGQEQLDIQGIRSIDDIQAIAPGIYFNRGGFGSDLVSSISIRGISSTAGAATTGVYIDDTPVMTRATIASGNFSANAYPRLFDIERVEVLRGPQGTLFGAGSEGGTVRFITPSPNLTKSSMYARSEVGSTESGGLSYEAGLAGGAPLIDDKLAFRASAWYRRDGGYVDRVSFNSGSTVDDEANYSDTTAARIAFTYAPTENLKISPSVIYQKIDSNDSSIFWVPNTENGFVQYLSDPNEDRYQSGQRVRQGGEQELTLSALKIDLDLGPVSLISNTSYYDREDNSVTDFTHFETPLWTGIFAGAPIYDPPDPSWTAPGTDLTTNRFFTQEVRLQSTDQDSPLTWVAGAFYSKNKIQTFRAVNNTFLPQLLSDLLGFCSPATCYEAIFQVPAAQGIYIFYGDTRTTDEQKALFGQLDYKITDHITATAGLRYAKLKYDFTNLADGPVNGPPAPRLERGSQEENATTPKFGLQYKTDGGNLFYATAAKGFRPGGANVPLNNPACIPDLAQLGLDGVPATYDSDSVWSYELGSKFALAENRLQINASVFKVKWKNIINNVSLQCILSFTTNLGEASSEGGDIDVQFRATENLLLSASLGYADAHYTQTISPFDADTGAVLTKPDGTAIELVGEDDALNGSAVTAHAAAQFTFDAFQLPSYARVDYSYQGQNDKTALLNPASPGYDPTSLWRNPSYSEVNLRLGSTFNGVDVSLFVNNLLDENPLLGRTRVYQGSPIITAQTLRPRTFGITAVYRY